MKTLINIRCNFLIFLTGIFLTTPAYALSGPEGTFKVMKFITGMPQQMIDVYSFFFTMMIAGSLVIWGFFLCLRMIFSE